jgi:Zn-dependent peptidase ImmA (M78 family)
MPVSKNVDDQTNRTAYYQNCRALAQAKRHEHSVATASLNLLVMARIYKKEGIAIDRRRLKGNRIKAAYYCDDGECSVLLNTTPPREPRLFALAHELKHHYLDREKIMNGQIECGDYNANEFIEKGAEVFAAEFIYPELEMRQLIGQMGITSLSCTARTIVNFKRACPACISYTFIVKRFVRFGLCQPTAFSKVQFTKIEEQIYGLPVYKRESFKLARARKRAVRTTRG